MKRKKELPSRFIHARRSAGLTQHEVAELCGKPVHEIKMLELGSTKFSPDLIEIFCQKVGVSRTYIYTGKGRPMDEETKPDLHVQMSNKFNQTAASENTEQSRRAS